MGGSTRFDSASLQQIRSRSLSDVHRLREHDAFHRRLKEAAKEGWMEGILRRLHVQPSVIKEAAAAVKLGLATPESLENVAKRASILALEAEDRTLGGGSKAAGAPKKVWQPFPSKQGDPANHALMWRKVPVTTLPTLQPLPGSSEAEHSNFRLLPGLHAQRLSVSPGSRGHAFVVIATVLSLALVSLMITPLINVLTATVCCLAALARNLCSLMAAFTAS